MTNSTLHDTRYGHGHSTCTPRGDSTPLRSTKLHKRISNWIRNKIDFGGSSTPSLFDTQTHVGLYYPPTGYYFKPTRRLIYFFSNFLLVFSSVSRVSYFMYYHTSHHHPIPYYIAIVTPYLRQTRTDMHRCMYPTLSIRPSVISFIIFTRLYNIHPIHLYSLLITTHTSLVYRPFVFWFSFRLENYITCTWWLAHLQVSPRRPNQLLWVTWMWRREWKDARDSRESLLEI